MPGRAIDTQACGRVTTACRKSLTPSRMLFSFFYFLFSLLLLLPPSLLVREDSTCCRARTLEPMGRNYWSPFGKEKPPQRLAHTPQPCAAPARLNWRKSPRSTEDPAQSKKKAKVVLSLPNRLWGHQVLQIWPHGSWFSGIPCILRVLSASY